MADIPIKGNDLKAPTNQQPNIAPPQQSSQPIPVNPPDVPPVSEVPEDLDTRWTRWRCLVCNYTYEGRVALKKCPKCGNEDPDKFDDVD